ncbi:MAG: S41 family peptidase [Bacteroidia bacterium]
MNLLKKSLKKIRYVIVIAAITGYALVSYSFVDNYFEVSKNLDIFATLFRELNIYYVDEIKPGELMKKGIDSMLESLDPYTDFYSESEIEDYRYFTTGQYGGVGALILQHDDKVVVSEPYEGFPAQKADLRAGDIILEINGVATKGKKTDDISKILKGQPGSTIKLLIERDGEKKPIEKNLTREEIKVKSVSWYGMLNTETGYIKLTSFTENAAKEVKDAMLELKKDKNMKSLIFDLRGNGGGLLKEAIDIVNFFVDKGQEIVSTRGKVKEWDRSHKALNPPLDLDIPIAVLVNRGSASASEIVSGSLQDLDRAVIIGQRSYGKGLVQQTRPLSYNCQLKVTVAKYYIPSGRCIQALDYTHRDEEGKVHRIADSLITAFKTKNGRTVYDGLGISPDVHLKPEKMSNIAISLINKNLIFDFATHYKSTHNTITGDGLKFFLSDAEYEEFVRFLSDKEYDYETKSEKTLDDLKLIAEKEKYFNDVKAEYDALQSKIKHNKKDDLNKNKPEIKSLLEEEIASRYYFQRGRIMSSLKQDPEVTEAIQLFSSGSKYKDILTSKVVKEKPKQDNED